MPARSIAWETMCCKMPFSSKGIAKRHKGNVKKLPDKTSRPPSAGRAQQISEVASGIPAQRDQFLHLATGAAVSLRFSSVGFHGFTHWLSRIRLVAIISVGQVCGLAGVCDLAVSNVTDLFCTCVCLLLALRDEIQDALKMEKPGAFHLTRLAD
jgi:hypothetical protein